MLLADLRSPEVGALSKDTPVVVPTGSLEQHGPHMPVFTDAMLCGEITRRAAERLGDRVLFAPVVWLGNAHHHLDFPGTLSVEPRTYLDLIGGILEGLIGQGFKRLVVLNGHGGNILPAQQVVFEVKQRHRERRDLLLLTSAYWLLGSKPHEIDATIKQTVMGHACEWETSMMLRLAPRLVGDYRNAAPVSLERPFSPAIRAWVSQDRTAAGNWGDPRNATPEKGEVLFRAFTDDVVTLLERVLSWDGESWEG